MLTKRGIPPYQESWHYPGSFLLKGEKIKDCLKRVAKKELGLNLDTNKMKFLGIYEDLIGDFRGHVVDAMYEYQGPENIILTQNQETEEFRFFRKLPPKMAFNHQATLRKLGYKS